MGKSKINLITSFNGGLASDRRVNQANKFAVTKHFDAFRYKHKLVPHLETVPFGNADQEAKNVTAFTVATQGASTAVWGLGKGVVDDTKIAVYYASGEGLAGGWIGPSNNESTIDYLGASGLESPKILFTYKDKLYTWANDALLEFTIGGAWDNSYYNASSVTSVAEPVHHPADDIAYFFHNNFVSKDNNGTFSAKVLTLPSNLKIVSSCAYGNYLAIGCVTKDSIDQKSTVFLWDRDSSLTTVSQQIDFGKGAIKKLANLNGRLTAVMDYHLVSATNTGVDSGSVRIKQANGDKGILVNEIYSDMSSNAFTYSIVDDEKIYIVMYVKLNGDERYGIWAIDSNGNATLDFIEGTITDVADGNYNGIFKAGNVWWIAHSNDGSIERTRTTGTPYSSTTLKSIYESLIFDGGDITKTKKLVGITIMTEALPANGSVVLQYRIDEDLDGAGSWTTILTHSGTDKIRSSAINISGATLPQHKEIQFRLESLRGAVITGLKFKTEIIEDDLY